MISNVRCARSRALRVATRPARSFQRILGVPRLDADPFSELLAAKFCLAVFEFGAQWSALATLLRIGMFRFNPM